MARCEDCIHKKVCAEVESLQCRRLFAWYNAEWGCPHFNNAADVAPRSEVEFWKQQCFHACMNNGYLDVAKIKENLSYGHPDPVGEPGDEGEPGMLDCTYWRMRYAEVAREIFEEIEVSIAVHAYTSKSEDYADGMLDAIEWVDSKIAELKKKYTEEGAGNNDT